MVNAYNIDQECIDWIANQAKKQDISASKLLNRIIKEQMNVKTRRNRITPARRS